MWCGVVWCDVFLVAGDIAPKLEIGSHELQRQLGILIHFVSMTGLFFLLDGVFQLCSSHTSRFSLFNTLLYNVPS